MGTCHVRCHGRPWHPPISGHRLCFDKTPKAGALRGMQTAVERLSDLAGDTNIGGRIGEAFGDRANRV